MWHHKHRDNTWYGMSHTAMPLSWGWYVHWSCTVVTYWCGDRSQISYGNLSYPNSELERPAKVKHRTLDCTSSVNNYLTLLALSPEYVECAWSIQCRWYPGSSVADRSSIAISLLSRKDRWLPSMWKDLIFLGRLNLENDRKYKRIIIHFTNIQHV